MTTKFDVSVLDLYIQKKLIRKQKHPELNVYIYNYTDKCQYNKTWDDKTLACRGLILDEDGNVIARSFPKFFNIEESNAPVVSPDIPFVIQEKMDGSMILLFYYNNKWHTATRGSFTSDQAFKAFELLQKQFPNSLSDSKLDCSLSYIFEIIYPENRIIVDYGQREELVYLTAFHKDGTEATEQRGVVSEYFNLVEEFDWKDYTTIKDLDWINSEGFVVRFETGERLKIKFENYVKLHRILDFNELTIWNWFKNNEDFDEKINGVPDEFHNWIRAMENSFIQEYNSIVETTQEDFAKYILAIQCINPSKDKERAMFAKTISDLPNKNLLFRMYDNKSIHNSICDLIKPRSGGRSPKIESNDKIIQNESLPGAYIFDIDGTLADNSHRDPFDWSKISEDTVKSCVSECARALMCSGFAIIICTGRNRCCESSTRQWLKTNNIFYDGLYIRKKGDTRQDFIVKEEMWRKIAKMYNIKAIFDDRNQVVNHGRKLGLNVFQVQEGNF